MTQSLHYWVGDIQHCRNLPDPTDEVLEGVRWGESWQLFTPAYWLSQLWMNGLDRAERSPYQARGSLAEELVFCMLGGYGITAELATAAFEACRSAELISERELSVSRWETELAKPLQLNGRSTRYRYPKQKARFLSNAMAFLRRSTIDEHCGRSLRDALLEINGVGPKTAGWVARNYLDTDDVAILDIHLVRAGVLCDLFAPAQRVERDYFEMERRYIEFCRALSARPAVLDCLIWDQMRSYGRVALGALSSKLGLAERPVSCRRRKSQLELSLAS
jgi:thermostable 8-oxoguanine DNA glycosylase